MKEADNKDTGQMYRQISMMYEALDHGVKLTSLQRSKLKWNMLSTNLKEEIWLNNFDYKNNEIIYIFNIQNTCN